MHLPLRRLFDLAVLATISMLVSSCHIHTWGEGSIGRLGDGTTRDRPAPTDIAGDGDSRTWIAVSAGGEHSCAVRADRTAWCWGENRSGQLGNGTFSDVESNPTQVGSDAGWATISAGSGHTCGIRIDGTAWCWGSNVSGRLGVPEAATVRHATAPMQVAGGASNWATISAGSLHTCATRTDGTAWCWGDNGWGQVGNGNRTDESRTPSRVGDVSTWASVSAGSGHTCANRTDGTAWCWGLNQSGQLGIGSRAPQTVEEPAQLGTASNWRNVSAGVEHTCATRTDGSAWCWGANYAGQLGDGTTTERYVPTRIGDSSGWAVMTVGGYHTCATRTDGTAWCWGSNDSGQLGIGTAGDGTTDDPGPSFDEPGPPPEVGSTTPVQVIGSLAWVTVDAGLEHTMGIAVEARG